VTETSLILGELRGICKPWVNRRKEERISSQATRLTLSESRHPRCHPAHGKLDFGAYKVGIVHLPCRLQGTSHLEADLCRPGQVERLARRGPSTITKDRLGSRPPHFVRSCASE